MSSIAHKRMEKQYFVNISNIINNEIMNSNIDRVTVTSVILSRDSLTLTIYLNIYKNKNKTLNALERTKGMIRSLLAKSISKRKTPNIFFKIDESIEHGNRIDAILKEINNK